MSDNDVPIETIAELVGHKGRSVTERVCRHLLKPVITKGAATMNAIFTPKKKEAKSADQAPISGRKRRLGEAGGRNRASWGADLFLIRSSRRTAVPA
jgi:hypothetical protein